MFSGTNEFTQIQWNHLANKDTFCCSVCCPFWCSPLSFLIHAIVCCQYSHQPRCHFCWCPFSCPFNGGKRYIGFITPISPCCPPLSIHSLKTNLSLYIFFGLTPTPCHWSWCPFMPTCHLNFFLVTLPCHAIPLGAPSCSHCPPSFFIVSSSSHVIFHRKLVVPHHPLLVVCHLMLSLIAILIFYVIIGTKLKHPQIL